MRVELPGAHRRRRKIAWGIALPLVLVMIAAAIFIVRRPSRKTAPPPRQAVSPPHRQIIKHPHIGLLLPLSGPFGDQGKMLELGVKLAWQELQDLGIQGQLITRNCGTDADTARRAAEELASDPAMLVVIAHLPEAVLTAIMPTYAKAKLLLLAPANSHQNLVGHPWLLPLVGSDRNQAKWAATIIQRWAAGKPAAVVHSAAPYGKLLYRAFKAQAQRLQLDFKTFAWATEKTSAQQAASALLRQNPAAIWLAGSPLWGARVVKALLHGHYQGRLLAPSSYGDPFVENLFDTFPENFFVLRPVLAQGQREGDMQEFCRMFRETFWRSPNWLAVLGYDALRWVGAALRQGSQSRLTLRNYFLQADSPDHAYHGVGGPVYFDSSRHLHRSPLLAVWHNGRLKPAPEALRVQRSALPAEKPATGS